MALAILSIMYIVIAIVAITVQVLLYVKKDPSRNALFIINMLFALLLSVIVYTSLPSNFIGQKIFAAAWAITAILALVIKLTTKEFVLVSKLMLTVAIVGNLVQLFI